MTETEPKKLRTWSAFGDIRRVPSEYEIVTHGLNYTARDGRKSALESNPTTPANIWLMTYRDKSPFRCDDWEGFRDPDHLTYRKYVELQAEQESVIAGVIDEYDDDGHDARLSGDWVAFLARGFTPMRYLNHALQMTQAYIGSIAPTSYVINSASFAAADLLRRNSVIAYRTKQLQNAWPDAGFGSNERAVWENDSSWQPARKAMETALAAYDWGEALAAVNLAIRPSIDAVILNALGKAANQSGDTLTWLLLSNLAADTERNGRWSAALAKYAIGQRADNAAALTKWLGRWSQRADDAVAGLAEIVAGAPGAKVSADEVLAGAREARKALLISAGLAQ
jgi:toluene monooxygenase system protein E